MHFRVRLFFFSYGRALRLLGTSTDETPTTTQATIAGSVSGLAITSITNPVDRIKILMQTQSNIRHANSISCFKYVVKEKGPLNLYYGYRANLLKECPGSAIWFGTYQALKNYWTPPNSETSLRARIFAGGISGSFAWTCIYPFDVIRSRLMAETETDNPKYKGIVDCFQRSVKLEGYKWCFRGYLPTIIRGFPVGAIILTLNDYFLKALSHHI